MILNPNLRYPRDQRIWIDVAEKEFSILTEVLNIKKEQYDRVVEALNMCDMLNDREDFTKFNKARVILFSDISDLESQVDHFEDVIHTYYGKESLTSGIYS